MLFSSNVFLFVFLPVCLAVYYISPRRLRNPILLLFSLFFYGWGEPKYLLLMLAVIALNFLCGLWIVHQKQTGGTGRSALIYAVAANLLILGFFKYANFFFGNLLPQIPLPIGISFYIFQSMSYIIDVYRGHTQVQRNALTFGTYVSLFPQLIAGPIVCYSDVADQMEGRQENADQFAQGIQIFLIGLSKKMLLANPMGQAWNLLRGQTGTLAAWMGLTAYALQIYFDFSGYSDMAIGLGKLFGFEFLKNFNYPYISSSITEFWRRWHISLSSWFREYVYIPLGGNRKGLPRQLINILTVWLLTGLWHGASWNYVLWGGYYALLLIAEKSFLLRLLKKCPVWLRRCYTLLAVLLGWALFYFEDMSELGPFLGRLFTLRSSASAIPIMLAYLPLMAAAGFAATPAMKLLMDRIAQRPGAKLIRLLACAAALVLCTAVLASQSYNPFIYFRF